MRVEICPFMAAAIASAVFLDSEAVDSHVYCHPDTVVARASISIVRGASEARCQEACSPITLNTGVRARLALCKFASPLLKPGPKCKRIMAGLSLIRP